MRLFAKLMLALLVIAMLLPFTFLKGKDGSPMLSFSNISLPSFSMPDFSTKDLTPSLEGMEGQDIFYKWYDAEGNVQFTTEPPAEGIEYTVKGFDPNTNVIQAVEIPVLDPVAKDDEPRQRKEPASTDLGNPYSQESIKKLFDEAYKVEKMLNERLKQQESALNQ